MEREPLISVIIPAYNSEKYIERCINSVQNQSYTNLEIIIINDGSIDSTKQIINEIKKQDKRIILVNKNNEGVSKARNDGIKVSKGEYIFFVDSDDYIDLNMINILCQALLEYDCQWSVCGFNNIYDDTSAEKFTVYNSNKKLSRSEFMVDMSEYLYSVYFGALWNKLYVSKIIKSNNIKFREDISLAEDFLFNLQYLESVNNVVINPECLYNYYQGNTMSLTKKKEPMYLWEMAKIRLTYCIDQYKKMGVFEQSKKNIYTAISNELIGPTYNIINDRNINIRCKEQKLKELYSNTIFKEAVFITKKKNMMHYIAKISLSVNSYKIFVVLMKIWVKVQRYGKS